MGSWGSYYDWAPRPTVGERKASAARAIAALKKKGRAVAPVVLEGRTIARTFWGKSWCENLERYADIANRIERGRSYVRSGSVIHLHIEPGRVEALVQGSDLYEVTITVKPIEAARYRAVVAECAGKIDSVIELLRGKLSAAVMEVITRKETGLFPAPNQLGMRCSCPDSARMCKHVAAVLYGIGARLDQEPELMFRLRSADAAELISTAAAGAIAGKRPVAKGKALEGDLAGMFGIELDMGPSPSKPAAAKSRASAKSTGAQAAAAPAAKLAKTAKPAKQRAPAAPPATITSAELTALGVSSATASYWAKTGVLHRTEQRGVYGRTPHTEGRIARLRALRARG
jgi:uncharacterized Zn finger protein